METGKPGVLLLNLGTPNSSSPTDVGTYLKEFLSDPFVVDIPKIPRWVLVNLLIIPKRKHASSELYKKVWTDRGSPLLFHSQDLLKKVRERVGTTAHVELCMRYGNPSIKSALEKLRAEKISKLTVFPLYPQYSHSASESSIQRVKELLKEMQWNIKTKFVPPFYHEESFLNAFSSKVQKSLQKNQYDKILFSFHGLPERHVKRSDPTGMHCVCDHTCCLKIVELNKDCYRAQCYATAHGIAKRVGMKESDYLVGFQSRLGRTPWIKPHSDVHYENLPKEGVKKLLVVSPSFVADCLETVEEISIRGRDQFIQSGGEVLDLVPSLNSDDEWVTTVTELVSLPPMAIMPSNGSER